MTTTQLAGSSVQRAIKELYVTRGDIQAIGKRSPLVTPLGGKVFWVDLIDLINNANPSRFALSYLRTPGFNVGKR